MTTHPYTAAHEARILDAIAADAGVPEPDIASVPDYATLHAELGRVRGDLIDARLRLDVVRGLCRAGCRDLDAAEPLAWRMVRTGHTPPEAVAYVVSHHPQHFRRVYRDERRVRHAAG